jgi:hypothetical protein
MRQPKAIGRGTDYIVVLKNKNKEPKKAGFVEL